MKLHETSMKKTSDIPQKRLTVIRKLVSFWKPLPRTTTRIFEDMQKPMKMDKREMFVRSSEILFRRLLARSQTCDIDLKTVLQYELIPLPPVLFTYESMRKTTKADLAKTTEAVL